MNGQGRNADIFQNRREQGRVQAGVVPAQTGFDRHRDVDRPGHGTDERAGFFRVFQHGRAGPDFNDLFHRAAHIDINGSRALLFKPDRGIAHFFGHRAKQLHAQRAVLRAGVDQFKGAPVFFEQRPRMDQLGGRQTEAAHFAHTPPKRQGRVTRKRSQEQIGRKRESAYMYRCHNFKKIITS